MIGKLAFALVLIVARAAAVADDVNKQVVDQRVLVEIYYQTLCPYCIRFITQQLKPVLSIPVYLLLLRISGRLPTLD